MVLEYTWLLSLQFLLERPFSKTIGLGRGKLVNLRTANLKWQLQLPLNYVHKMCKKVHYPFLNTKRIHFLLAVEKGRDIFLVKQNQLSITEINHVCIYFDQLENENIITLLSSKKIKSIIMARDTNYKFAKSDFWIHNCSQRSHDVIIYECPQGNLHEKVVPCSRNSNKRRKK